MFISYFWAMFSWNMTSPQNEASGEVSIYSAHTQSLLFKGESINTQRERKLSYDYGRKLQHVLRGFQQTAEFCHPNWDIFESETFIVNIK